MTRALERSCRAVAAAGLVALAGCGGAKPAPVAGKLTLDGAPLAGAGLLFHPADGGGLRPGAAATDGDGKFTASGPSGPGLLPGQYKVAVQYGPGNAVEDPSPKEVAIDSADYAKLMSEAAKKSAGKEKAADEPKGPKVPAKYAAPGTTPLTVIVPPGGDTNVELKVSSK